MAQKKVRLVLIIALIAQFLPAQRVHALEDRGYADHRLIVARGAQGPFNPNQDILSPTEEEKAADKVKEKLMGSAMGALVPLTSYMSGPKGMGEESLYLSLLGAANHMKITLEVELKNIPPGHASNHRALLLPYGNLEKNLFYNNDKISMDASDVVNVIGLSPNSPSFDKKVTENIKLLQDKYYRDRKDSGPVYLLGLTAELDLKGAKRFLYVRALVGIRAATQEFVKTSPMVNFKQIEIPSVTITNDVKRDIVGSMTFIIDLSNQASLYQMYLDFGDFDKFEQKEFLVNKATQSKYAPKLIGNIAKPKLQALAANFALNQFIIDLKTRQVTELATYSSFGLEMGGKRYMLGGIHIGKVDGEFKNEINKTIDAETTKAVDGAIQSLSTTIAEKLLGERK